MQNIALALFALTYVLLLVFADYRAYIALGSAVIFVLMGILPVSQVFGAIDWNVLMMIAGTMGTVALFIESRMPALLADIILEKVPNVKWAIVALALFAGFISAFVDNVATVLMVAPVALAVSKKLEISPVSVIISIAVASNLQGAATLVGDTTSILLGGYADMNFLDFFWYANRPGMFFVVQLGALMSTFVLLYYFRDLTQKIAPMGRTEVTDYFPSYLMLGTVGLLILASFVQNKPETTNGIICMVLFAIGLIKEVGAKKDTGLIKKYLAEIDYQTLLLLGGLFVVIAGIREAGVVDSVARLFVQVGSNNIFVIYTLIVWASVILSAFIDNIPYVATMLPVVAGISNLLGVEPHLLYFGLLTGATLGGNLTPIGASANITGIGILKKEGHSVSTMDFMKIGIPFTLSAVIAGYVAIWVFWA